MAEPVDWGTDGTPRSPRFDDIYRPADGGLAQARGAFLAGCGLPAAWAGQRQWRILETGFGLGLNFLATWRAWKDDPRRPQRLHFTSIEAFPVGAADLLRGCAGHAELFPLAEELAAQWWGLLPGFHRLTFEGGRVQLTLCVGDVVPMLQELAFSADTVFLDGFDPQRNPAMWQPEVVKGVARLCRRGAGVATWTVAGDVRRALESNGFQVDRVDGVPPKRHRLQGRYDPAWTLRGQDDTHVSDPRRKCIVVGAGLAGAAGAAALAARGWQVQVLDRASDPAAGASALPAGLMAPAQSPDDNLLSHLTRAGIRLTLQQARLLLEGRDWACSGALEHRIDDPREPPDLGPEGAPWTRGASAAQKAEAGLPTTAQAWWHAQAAWIRPGALVHAWLAQDAIAFRGGVAVERIERQGGDWCVLDAAGAVLAHAPLLVLAAAGDCARLLQGRIALTPVRGQVSWGWHSGGAANLPPVPLHGHGHFLPRVPLDAGEAWLTGSTFGRGDLGVDAREGDHQANLQRLAELAPAAAAALRPAFDAGTVRAWTGTRWASRDRRPLAGLVEPGLAVCTAMGSRGLTFATLCGELLAAQLEDEPWPLPKRLAAALDVARQLRAT